jgi:hypothetical protein
MTRLCGRGAPELSSWKIHPTAYYSVNMTAVGGIIKTLFSPNDEQAMWRV